MLFSDENGEDLYYCETTVKFDIVGKPIAYSLAPLEFMYDKRTTTISPRADIYHFKLKQMDNYTQLLSDLDYPLDVKLVCDLNKVFNTIDSGLLHITASTTCCGITVDLFSITLDNLSYYQDVGNPDKKWGAKLNIYYSSETGLLFYNFGDAPIKLLSFQESASTGERLAYSRRSIKFRWPGRFSGTNEGSLQNYTINLSASVNKKESADSSYCTFDLYDRESTAAIQVEFTGRSRTNVI